MGTIVSLLHNVRGYCDQSKRDLPPTPRLTLVGNGSLLKSCVNLNTATGGDSGTSLNTDMVKLCLVLVETEVTKRDSEPTQLTKEDFALDLGIGKWARALLPIEIQAYLLNQSQR